jgi:hypothetical protein
MPNRRIREFAAWMRGSSPRMTNIAEAERNRDRSALRSSLQPGTLSHEGRGKQAPASREGSADIAPAASGEGARALPHAAMTKRMLGDEANANLRV